MIQPSPYGTGTLSFKATLSDDLVIPLAANTPTDMVVSRNGQNGRWTFDAVAGSTVHVQVNVISTTPANQALGLGGVRPRRYALRIQFYQVWHNLQPDKTASNWNLHDICRSARRSAGRVKCNADFTLN